MKIIDVKKNRGADATQKRITVLAYGESRAGKTHFAASFPRPLFLAEATESGWTTIEGMSEDVFYEKNVLPDVWGIESPADMMQSITNLEQICAKTPEKYKTVVIDSLTFYADTFLAFLEAEAAKNPKEQGLRVYMKFLQHIRHLMGRIHQLPLNVVWLCLAKAPGEGSPVGGIMLTGKSADIAPARCDYWFYQRSYRTNPDAPLQYALHTRPYGMWPAGGRDGGLLPDVITDVTYRSVMAEITKSQQKKQQGAAASATPPANGQPVAPQQ